VDVGGAEILKAGRIKAASAEDYLKQFPGVAVDVLGKKRAELLISGKYTLNDMIDKTVLSSGNVRLKTLKTLTK
jgi:hypothetical protein